MVSKEWKTKPTDRFILRWIKLNLSAPISLALSRISWLRPSFITCCSSSIGILAGILVGLGYPWQGAVTAAVSQVLDGVDGQLARLKGKTSRRGALLDSVLDRYSDGVLLMGLALFAFNHTETVPGWLILILGGLALLSSSAISYSTSRAEALGLPYLHTYASKGTRSTVMVLSSFIAAFWPTAAFLGVLYLSVHPTCSILSRLVRWKDIDEGQSIVSNASGARGKERRR